MLIDVEQSAPRRLLHLVHAWSMLPIPCCWMDGDVHVMLKVRVSAAETTDTE
jgi:hypothetical protein